MDGIEFWHLATTLTVVQAALLVCGEDPAAQSTDVESLPVAERPRGYEATKTALATALVSKGIVGRLVPLNVDDRFGGGPPVEEWDLAGSSVDVESLRAWLASRGFRKGFFFPDVGDTPEYLDPQNPRFAHKLAAAVDAWIAVGAGIAKGKNAKEKLKIWLRQNAAKYKLLDGVGNPQETTIEEIARLANWEKGGAPKTPGG